MNVREQVVRAQEEIIESLARCEENISILYGTYAKRFPESHEFWADLARKEVHHAKLLRTTGRLLHEGTLLLHLGRFEVDKIKAFLAKVGEEIDLAKKGEIDALHAIKTALYIESSVLDAHFYDIVQSEAEEYQKVAEELSTDTQNHVKAVQDHLLHIRLGQEKKAE